jgi:hypothetical protein
MTVAELGDRMSSRELSEWMVFYTIEPFGGEVEDIRNAISTTAIVNSANGIKQGVTPETFRLTQSTEPEQDPQALYEKMRGSRLFRPRERGT